MTEEQAQNLKRGEKIKFTEPLSVVDTFSHKNGDMLAQTSTGHLVFIHPHEVQLAEHAPSEASPAQDTAQDAPKYDPCRLFRKGDKVREILVKGRRYDARYPVCLLGEIATVEEKEDPENLVTIRFANGMHYTYDAAYLELITPVEELETYYLDTITTDDNNTKPYFLIKTRKHEHIIRTFYSNAFETIEQTKAAAEAERDRLNAEYRKEMEK